MGYVNFLLVDAYGNPRLLPPSLQKSKQLLRTVPNARKHLLRLIQEVCVKALGEADLAFSATSQSITRTDSDTSKSLGSNSKVNLGFEFKVPDMILAAFSKGHVVLNALLQSDSDTFDSEVDKIFWNAVHQIHYLDAGASGNVTYIYPTREILQGWKSGLEKLFDQDAGVRSFSAADVDASRQTETSDSGLKLHPVRNRFILPALKFTETSELQSAGRVESGLFFHATPRQLDDPSRPRIRTEWTDCMRQCQDLGIRHRSQEYFANESTRKRIRDDRTFALRLHFKILEAFEVDMPGITSSHSEVTY